MGELSELGLIGLGVMGKGLARSIADQGLAISVYNRHVPGKEEDIAHKFVEQLPSDHTISPFDHLDQFVKSLKKPRIVLTSIRAGVPMDDLIDELIPLLDSDDLLVDTGNAHFRDTIRRTNEIEKYRVHFVGAGISGGREGLPAGPAIMIGGSMIGYSRIQKIFEGIAARDKSGKPCCAYVGSGAAGHFVKMAHNGIEYADMQLIAEVYFLLRHYGGLNPEQVADVFDAWSKEGQQSFLLSITSTILRKKEGGKPLVDKILDSAQQNGTGSWSVQAAMALGAPLDSVSAAVMARFLSKMKNERMASMSIYDHSLPKLEGSPDRLVSELFGAYAGGRITNHAMGFDLQRIASEKFAWNLNLSEIARIWTAGCILQSELMDSLVETFEDTENDNLLMHPDFTKKMKYYQYEMASIIAQALQNSYPVPVLSAGLNYYLGYINGQSPANLIQAQRDYFGAHGYQKVGEPPEKFFNTDWSK